MTYDPSTEHYATTKRDSKRNGSKSKHRTLSRRQDRLTKAIRNGWDR